MGFLDWYLREFRKAAEERRVRDAERDASADRYRRFWAWFESPEGGRAIAERASKILQAEAGFPDTAYDMSSGPDRAFTISSRSAGATLSGKIDGREGFAFAWLRRADGESRHWRQGIRATMLGDLGDGPFDEDERLAAALLRSNPRSGWPGRGVSKTRYDEREIAERIWEEMTGEKLINP